jgi:D-arabinose 1-dehydrogenase-like Zn-dependent alcohol dehydrogenase
MTPPMGKAAVCTGPGQPLDIREYPVLPPAPDAALLRLASSGICGTDLHILEGRLPVPPPFIPGHEFIGRVQACGTQAAQDGLGRPLRPGDLAIACVALPCGQCFTCRQGETSSCLRFGVTYVRDPEQAPHFFGGYAEYLQQPAQTLVRIPHNVQPAAAAAFPCAGPTVIRALASAGNLHGDELVVVQGTGPVGLFAVAWAAQAGCRVLAIGSGASPARQELAARLGAARVMDYRGSPEAERRECVLQAATDLGRGDGADVVIETSGSPRAIPEGLNLLRTRGLYVVPGQYSQSGDVSIEPQLITFKALRIIGSGQYRLADIGVYLDFLAAHPALQPLFAACVTHRFPVEAANDAMAAVGAGRTGKAVLAPADEASGS